MRKTWMIIVVLLVVSCGARSRATREGRETIAKTGTVDLGRLTSAETLLLVDIVRTEASPCEGDLSLLETLEKPDPCARAAVARTRQLLLARLPGASGSSSDMLTNPPSGRTFSVISVSRHWPSLTRRGG